MLVQPGALENIQIFINMIWGLVLEVMGGWGVGCVWGCVGGWQLDCATDLLINAGGDSSGEFISLCQGGGKFFETTSEIGATAQKSTFAVTCDPTYLGEGPPRPSHTF